MHIILAVLGSLITILILARRLSDAGIDLGWLNPFTWHRRRQWRQKVQANPLYALEDPMEAAAGLMYTAAKASGDITREHKDQILQIFEKEFELSNSQAVELLSSSSYLIKDEDDVVNHTKKFLNPSIEKFTANQFSSMLTMINQVIAIEPKPSNKQNQLVTQLNQLLTSQKKPGQW